MLHRLGWVALTALLFMGIAPAVYASDNDQVHVGRSIDVAEDETAGSLVCVGCSVQMTGSSEDIVVVGGSVTIDGTVRGDVVAIGGPIRLNENAAVAGDVVTVGGRLWRHPGAVVKGDVSAKSGALILAGLFLVPLLPVILIVALVVWAIDRNRPNVAARV